MLRRAAVCVLLSLTACAGSSPGHPAGDGGPTDGGGGDGGLPAVRTCTTRIHYRLGSGETAVAVSGEWDWTTRTPLVDDDGDGDFTADLDLAAGLWAYKLVVTTASGDDWRLDPDGSYRKYDGGVENSAVRVADCDAPLVAIESAVPAADGLRVSARVLAGKGGSPIDPATLTVALDHEFLSTPVADVHLDGRVLAIHAGGLAPGKYTVRIDVADRAGRAAETVRLPFWVEAERFDWRDALIYMVMTDRFRDGDPSNDPAPALGADPAADYHGGDLAGVTQAIEDGTFDALGVRALWLSPWNTAASAVEYEGGHGVTGYHGYWPIKARAIDPRLGDEAALEALVRAAHRHGLRVLMDLVVNHVHQDHEYLASHPEWFRHGCECGTPGCDWTEHRLDCSFHSYLPDVDWRVTEAAEQFVGDAMWWLERFDLDGFRVDAVKHVEDAAVIDLRGRIHAELEGAGTSYFLLGETAMGWSGDDLAANQVQYDTISHYIGPHGLSGQFDFVLYHATAYRVFADLAKGLLHLDYWTRMSAAEYPSDAVMTPFVGSHDTERFISLATYGSGDPLVHHKWASDGLPGTPSAAAYDRAALALTWLVTVPGAPLLYYGDEYGEPGGADPDNRHPWRAPAARTAAEQALFTRVARAGQARAELIALRRGDYRTLDAGEDVLAYARTAGPACAIVVLNRGAAAVTRTLTLPADLPIGASLRDRLDPTAPPIAPRGGQLTVTVAAHAAAILAPGAAP